MATTKVQELNNGQFITTIPKPLAEAMGVKKGTILNWKVLGAGRLELTL